MVRWAAATAGLQNGVSAVDESVDDVKECVIMFPVLRWGWEDAWLKLWLKLPLFILILLLLGNVLVLLLLISSFMRRCGKKNVDDARSGGIGNLETAEENGDKYCRVDCCNWVDVVKEEEELDVYEVQRSWLWFGLQPLPPLLLLLFPQALVSEYAL